MSTHISNALPNFFRLRRKLGLISEWTDNQEK